MTIVRMKLPIFGSAEGEFYPCFYLTRMEDETNEEFVSEVEQFASSLGRFLKGNICLVVPSVVPCPG